MSDVTAPETLHTYKFKVAMSCGGCSGAVNRVLGKLEGVDSYNVSLEDQSATVTAKDSLSYQTVYDTIAKTNKKILSGEADNVVIHKEEA